MSNSAVGREQLPPLGDSLASVRAWLAAYEAAAGADKPLCPWVFDQLEVECLREPAARLELTDLLAIMAGLAADPHTLCSAMLFLVEGRGDNIQGLEGELPEPVRLQLASLRRLQQVQSEHVVGAAVSEVGASAEGLRRLLLALVGDIRIVLIALGWQLVQLRSAKQDPERAARLARETMLIHAPLANRLGVWQLKWELEDLAFRFSEPEAYKRIAKQVAERRADREAFIQDFKQRLKSILREAGIPAEVKGRPKHIYSIYRKMQRKGLDIRELFDLHAVRVLVDDLPSCYTVLGLVHTNWQSIPGEFDDYITTPKGNNYQSLHTAVIGPEGKPVEVQIRSWAMNEHAELGVAAHWRYKEGGPKDPSFDRKVVAMRQLLESSDELMDDETLLASFQSATEEDRVYVLTPQGKVMDLSQGATVLDFAYAVHTEVGHRCRGAKVNGRIVPLTQVVANGDRVEILTAREPRPSRDWLNPRLGFITGARARVKVRQWFKKESREDHLAAGRDLVEAELRRMDVSAADLEAVPPRFNLSSLEDLYVAVGNGELTAAQIVGAAERLKSLQDPVQPEGLVTRAPRRQRGLKKEPRGGITIQGVGNLVTTVAGCCQPLPGESVVGYITRGRGVSVHRSDCAHVLQWQVEEPQRLLEVHWTQAEEQRFKVMLQILAYDRRELFKDISTVLAHAEVRVIEISSHPDPVQEQVDIRLQVEVQDYDQLSDVLARLAAIRNVIEARRLRDTQG